VYRHEHLVVELNHDALARTAYAGDAFSQNGIDARLDRSENEWTGDAEALQATSHNAVMQGVNIKDNVGKLRQRFLNDYCRRAMAPVVQTYRVRE
jgi:hypothetical protein